MNRADLFSEIWHLTGRHLAVCLAVTLMATAAPASEFGEPILLGSLDPQVDRYFGAAVALDGDTLAVGAPYSPEGGVVYIYERQKDPAEPWKLIRMLAGVDPAPGEHFGAALAMDGDTLVVGAPYERSRAELAGAAYIFYRDRGGPGNWGRVRVLAPKSLEEYTYYGTSVATSDNRVAVGSVEGNKVWVHERNRPTRNRWGVQAELEAELTSRPVIDAYGRTGQAPGLGAQVALSGRTLAVSAITSYPKYGSHVAERSYGAFVFELDNDGNWRQLRHHGSPALPTISSGDLFGLTLSLDGSALVVGYATNPRTGAHLYERDRGGKAHWGRRMEMPDPRGDFGRADRVMVRGNTAVLAGNYKWDEEPYSAEGALVYQRHLPGPNKWKVVGRLLNPQVSDSAWSIAIGPREVVLGHGYPGLVQIFPRKPMVDADFESGEITGFSRVAGNLEVVSPGLGGSEYALAVQVDGTRKATVLRARQPQREPRMSLGFDLAANRVNLADSRVEIMNFYGPTRNLVRLTLEADPLRDQYWATLWAWDQERGWREVGRARMPPVRDARVQLEWRVASGPGARDGLVLLEIDGVIRAQAQDLDTDRQFIKGLLMGLPKGSEGAVGGEFLLDEIELGR